MKARNACDAIWGTGLLAAAGLGVEDAERTEKARGAKASASPIGGLTKRNLKPLIKEQALARLMARKQHNE